MPSGRTLAMLEAVQIRDPELVYHLYPHQLSGGMGQRVMIAMMLIAEPDLLIADEPTSALDVTVQNEVLRILDDLVRDRGMGLIFISHNLTMVSSFCDRVLIMYGGRIVEECAAPATCTTPQHPYTRALIAAAPSLDDPRSRTRDRARAIRRGSHDRRSTISASPSATAAAPVHAVQRRLVRGCGRARPSASSANPDRASRRCSRPSPGLSPSTSAQLEIDGRQPAA